MWRIGILFSLSLGCAPSALSNPDAGGNPDLAAPTEVKLLRSLDESCADDATLTGRAVLNDISPEYSANYTPAGGGAALPLTIKLAYAGGEVRCHPAMISCDGCGAPDRPAYVEL